MFTDQLVTPVRLEALINLLRRFPSGIKADEARGMMQPASLGESEDIAKKCIAAAKELGLVEAKKDPIVLEGGDRRTAREALLVSFEDKVLRGTEIEPYFALFYSFYLGAGVEAYGLTREEFVNQFNESVFGEASGDERLNPTQLTGFHRWLSFAGLGWYDPSGEFQADPFERVRRALPTIFGKQKALSCDDFVSRLGQACPELDGGDIFLRANKKRDRAPRTCTLGLSHALIGLHLDGEIFLSCPADNTGWSLGEATPSVKEGFTSDRFERASLGGGKP